MLDYINNHQAEFWLVLGFILLSVEVFVFSLGSGVLLFAGVGALMSSALMWSGVVSGEWIHGIAAFGVCTGLSAVVLWKRLKSLQGGTGAAPENTGSDLIGYQFTLSSRVAAGEPGVHRYSGIDWRVEVARDCGCDALDKGVFVVVSDVGVGVFMVKPLN